VKSIDHLGEVRGKTVLVRTDMNVPLDGSTITDDGRIRAAIPTIQRLVDDGARVLIVAHLGRPKGQRDPALSLRPVAERLGELMSTTVRFAGDTVDEEARRTAGALGDGEIGMLENVRFHRAETCDDDDERDEFASRLAALANLFVSDGFGVVHRTQASVVDITRHLPSVAGDLVRSEVAVLHQLTSQPERPYTVVLGGSKVSDKLGVIERLITRADTILIGGGMAFTFLAARGYEVGTSMVERDQVGTVEEYVRRAAEKGTRFVLPDDVVIAPRLAADAPAGLVSADRIPNDQMGLDIGADTAQTFADHIRDSRTVFWNGPMGVFELPAFAEGTRRIAEALTQMHGLSVVGGGDSAAAVRTLGYDDTQFGHISTGGGASLEYLEGRTLPGLAVLEDT